MLISDVAEGGVLDRLRVLADDLASSFGWDVPTASSFVLTGATPLLSTLSVSVVGDGFSERVVIEVDPMVPVEEVANAYMTARHELRGPRHRLPFQRGLDLVIHAAQRPGASGPALRRSWNRTHPDEAYASQRAFRQALRGAERLLLNRT